MRDGSRRRCDTRSVRAGGGDSPAGDAADRATAAVDLYWLPLGAGGHFVRLNGRVYEAVAARLQRRPRVRSLPLRAPSGGPRGEVRHRAGAGPRLERQGAGRRRRGRRRQSLGRPISDLPLRDPSLARGHIPDVAEAVDSPRRLTSDEDRARRVLDVVAQVPTPVWGRDELATGEMWNSNSVIAWVIARSGIDTEAIQPPPGGAPPAGRLGSWSRAGMAASCHPKLGSHSSIPARYGPSSSATTFWSSGHGGVS